MCHNLKFDLLMAQVNILVLIYIVSTIVNGKKMQYSVGHKYKGQMEVATFWCGFVFQQLDIQFWSQRASSCLRWTQQRRRWRTVVGKDKKRTKSEKIYFKISKDIDHYKQLIVDAGNGIIWKKYFAQWTKMHFIWPKILKKKWKF